MGGTETHIEQRREARTGHIDPDYAGKRFRGQAVEGGRHRRFVGGKWKELGQLQYEFLVSHGLAPENRFLDVACGALRAGRVLVPYLEPSHYYGIDINHDLVVAGYDVELDDAARSRLPPENLRVTDRFDADFGVRFDMAIAQSLFTHISLNQMRLCLWRLAKVMAPGARFYATFFERPDTIPVDEVEPYGERGLYSERNLYSYYRSDVSWVADPEQWSFRYIGDWGHPVGQRIVEYTRSA